MAQTLSSHNLPTDRARALFNPSKEAESLLASVLKNPGTLDFNFFWYDVTTGQVKGCGDGMIRAWKNVEVAIHPCKKIN